MSFQHGSPLTFIADTAIPRGRFVSIVGITAEERVILAPAGSDAIGVSADDAEAGDEIAVFPIDGQSVVEVEANGAILPGFSVTPGGATTLAGRAVLVGDPGEAILGIALSTTSATAGEFVSVLLQKTATLSL